MPTLTANATVSLSANGSSSIGSISWDRPNIPVNAIISSIVISGSWVWNGKGQVTNVTINGTKTFNGIAFSIDIGTNTTPPMQISCSGNKNATGDFFNWSNLIVVYTYAIPIVHHTITASIDSGGSITPSGAVSVVDGENQIFQFTPSEGYRLKEVLIDGVNTATSNGTYTFINVTTNHTIKPVFELIPQYTITISSSGGGSVSPSTTTVIEGESITFIFTPDEAYKVSEVLLDGAGVQIANNTYTISNVTADHTLSVTFVAMIQTAYIKLEGVVYLAAAVWKMINGVWIRQTALRSAFDNNVIYSSVDVVSTILTDENGIYLTDENGNYLID